MIEGKKPRWDDVTPNGKPKIKVGDLFWINADNTIRVVVRCSVCGKGFLVLWNSNHTKALTCKACSGKK
jgi:DNA-directed RNA polymerase subunit RPC12/RpoP